MFSSHVIIVRTNPNSVVVSEAQWRQSQYIFGVQHSTRSRQFQFFSHEGPCDRRQCSATGVSCALRQLPFWNKAHSREVVQAHVIPVLIVIRKEHSENANACQFFCGLSHYFSGTTQQVISEGGVRYLLETTTRTTSLKQSCCSTILGLPNRITRWSLVNYLIRNRTLNLAYSALFDHGFSSSAQFSRAAILVAFRREKT